MEVQIIAVIMKLLNHSVTPEVPILLRSQYFFGFQAHNTTMSILPSRRYFVSSLKVFYDAIRQTFLAPGGGGVRTPRIPLPTGLGI